MRILIFGNSGSGKSTLARRLAAEQGLALLALDDVVWSKTKFAERRPDREVARDLEDFVRSHPAWVAEGCYGKVMEQLCPQATELIFMNPGVTTCVSNCLARPWEAEKYPTKEEQDKHLAGLLEWVRAYYDRDDDMSLADHRRIFDSFRGRKREIAGNEPLR